MRIGRVLALLVLWTFVSSACGFSSDRAVTVLNCQGLVVTAGFWNGHIHLLSPAVLHADKRTPDEISSQTGPDADPVGFYDRVRHCFGARQHQQHPASNRKGRGVWAANSHRRRTFLPEDGTPIYVKGFLEENHIPSAEVQSTPQALERAQEQIRDGADGIKIFAGAITAEGVLPMPMDQAKAIVAEAHRAGKPVFAHPSNSEGLEIAIQSGVDVLAHTAPMSGDWTLAFVHKLKAAHLALIPTLTLFDVEAKKAKVSNEEHAMWISQPVQELKACSEAGGQILFGTDVGYIDQYDITQEFTLRARAGMSFQQILASLTTSPARRFGYASHSGSIAKGMDADLVVLDGDPAKDVTAFAKVHQVIRGGKLIYPASLAKELRGFQPRQFQSSRPCLGFNHSLLRLSGFFAVPFPT